ncbi:puromycin-sensitive aminopeptidase [Apostasia shenzhenica]|uniref:Aminopeptidase n=1 Tax=Apostasia shenzhenica TaxID=1088818 RepID=A0A2I0B6C7_9ASPA|nr:puromycin-sensitive aminopeptidase [Apostasia shenzhenica]
MTGQQSLEQFKGQARLPKFAVPRRYDLFLKPDLAACKFSGSVEIAVDVVADTGFLILNAAELAVEDGSVWFQGHGASQKLRPLEITNVEKDEILVLRFNEVLPHGEGVLGVRFQGTLNDRMKGFYRSVYEHDGAKKNMAVTQFEPADARRCFPCWDEPAFKATFKITLEVPSDQVALSNMPVEKEEVNGDLKKLFYQESPIMSTYLVAVIVGLFDYVEASTTDGIKVRVYCQTGKSSQGKFALDVAVKTLDVYKEYFAVPYPLPKLDMIAIPDFAAGAMENYGLVTYRETALLYDERHSAASNKQRVATVVGHELAHQWFGNLVTMEWWTHLWLNEGFATWVSYLAADSLFPEWKIWTQFLDDSVSGLRLDALAESHPIEVDINHASEIDEIFDAISYLKGASLIRMLQCFLGVECFQRSLASYVKKFAYSNAKTEDLWSVLEEESGEPVKMLMDSWTKQKGYPVVLVSIKEGNLDLEQSHFLASGSSGDGEWIVPITLCSCSYAVQKKLLLKTKTEKINVDQLFDSSNQENDGCLWVKLNVDQTGFYRVKYDGELETGIRYAVENHKLSATDRFGILDDSFALCMASKQSLSSLLSLMIAYREDPEYTVLSHLVTVSYKVVNMIADANPELSDDIKQLVSSLLQPSAERLGWDPKEGESHLDAMLRGEVLTALAHFGHDITRDEGLRRFNAFLNDRDTPLLPPDTRHATYVAVMQTVDKSRRSGFESLLKIYKETDLSQEKTRILSCLASSPNPDVVLDALNFVLSSEVRNQDAVFGLGGISSEGREVAWKWLKDHWDYISKTWGSGFLITTFVSRIVSPFSSYEKADEIEEFFSSRVTPAISRTLKQSLERVKINANWVKSIRSESSLAKFVKELAYRKY